MRARVLRQAIQRHCIVLSAVLLLLLAPAALWAHTALLRSVPASGAHVPLPPVALRLTFSEAPELAFTTLALVDAAGAAVALAPTTVAPESRRTLVAPIRGSVRAGVYTVRWQVAGADGHPIRGQYTFVVAGTVPATGEHHDPVEFPSGVQGFGAESTGYVVLRWLQLATTVMVLGSLCFVTMIVRGAARGAAVRPAFVNGVTRRATRAGAWAVAALALVAVLRLLAQSIALHGPQSLTDWALMQSMLLHTRWGSGWGVQILGVLLAGWAFVRQVRSANAHARGWILAWIGGGLLAVSLAMSGHAIAVPDRPLLAVMADAVHVLSSGAWMGSLLIVLAIGVPTARAMASAEWPSAVAALVRGLHPIALGAVGLLTATGAYGAWLHVGSIGALWQTGYGRTLLVKLALVATAVAIGGYNARRVRPRLVNAAGVQRFERAAGAELVAGLLVLLITAVLVATPTALDAAAMQAP